MIPNQFKELYKKPISLCLLLIGCLFFNSYLLAQSSASVYHGLLKLKETKKILYVAAHPDDENTRLIAYLANEEMADVAYLSLTRGDGGQNLIGKELGMELGMIRTQELLKARETDGGKQFFSRAIDFGYSRNPNETLNNWDRKKLLSDVVWVIRNFQPDIIITRFNTTPGITHGHHTTSAIIAGEAFKVSGDPNAFPEQLTYVEPWSAKRIFWNAYNWGGVYDQKPGKQYYQFPVGNFNPILGLSYSQIAANSRTMHKSQGFGATASIGHEMDLIELVDGKSFDVSPFEDLEPRWLQLSNGSLIVNKISHLIDTFDFVEPSNNIEQLIEIKKELNKIQKGLPWVKEKQGLVDQLIRETLGWRGLFLSDKELNFPEAVVHSKLILNQVTDKKVKIKTFEVLDRVVKLDTDLSNNNSIEKELDFTIPKDHLNSQPYWLRLQPDNNLYTVKDQEMIGKAYNSPTISGKLTFTLLGEEFEVNLPLQFRYNDRVSGEVIQPFKIVPEVAIAVKQDNVFLLNEASGIVDVIVNFGKELKEGVIRVDGLNNNEYRVKEIFRDIKNKAIHFQIELNKVKGEGKTNHQISFVTNNAEEFDKGITRIIYPHIPNLTYFPKVSFNLIRLNLNLSPQTIGYIPGAGDKVPEILQNIGYRVEMIDASQLGSDLQKYTTIITGIRAFNVNQDMVSNKDALMEYVKAGGNLIVQYNTTASLLSNEFGPYPLTLSRDRVTVENSPVELLLKNHPVLNLPNIIVPADFDGWVQERGLYFPGSWDERYQSPLLMQDPGENASKGSLLHAKYGKGTYTYSGISWFRLLPAGVPGAIKLFVNLIEQGHEK
ncbi:PIG-L family deacetylase [Cyclobacterium marinum]|uniref:PIG-L family deacetylase n=1 Tax=Cyclobacterium marinum TaxID=104 RepID=UPI0011EEAE5D|nr:PIG-L family deacetylase [Cyclobacterium marinum]MBI0397745.1 PIG-L family deacetylase [Cyclobacterium marinum]|tara:strand:+ start:47326 stop:49818 length:2493 start_codon:yes stop_codon:yes gene_type:complete